MPLRGRVGRQRGPARTPVQLTLGRRLLPQLSRSACEMSKKEFSFRLLAKRPDRRLSGLLHCQLKTFNFYQLYLLVPPNGSFGFVTALTWGPPAEGVWVQTTGAQIHNGHRMLCPYETRRLAEPQGETSPTRKQNCIPLFVNCSNPASYSTPLHLSGVSSKALLCRPLSRCCRYGRRPRCC